MIGRNGNANITSRLLTVREGAQQLAIKEGTLRLWLAQRRIPYIKAGRAVRIPLDAIEQFLAANLVPARESRYGY